MDYESWTISSAANPRIKHLKKLLTDKTYRYENEEFVVEGKTLVNSAKNIKEIYALVGKADPADFVDIPIYILTENVFKTVSEVENPQGIMAICAIKNSSLQNSGKYILLDGLQDPGNLGTIMRTAAGFSYQGVIMGSGCVDPYSPKVVRSSMGAIFTLEIIFLKKMAELVGHQLIVADASGQPLAKVKPQPNHILVIGKESQGASPEILKQASLIAAIPMNPKMESFNAAVAAGIIMYQLSINQ